MRKAAVVFVVVSLTGCGGASSGDSASNTTTTSSSRAQNDKVIQQAEQGHDNQAQLGAAAIRRILDRKLNLDAENDFNLNHRFQEGEVGSDCYVKLGAEAVNFEDQSENILRSPNGRDLVFVQSSTTTPLVKCLKAVRTALGW